MATVSYQFSGMNNTADPLNVGAPLPNSRQLIFTEMSKMVNADPDNFGGCQLRPGQVSVSAVATHSGWTNPYIPREMFCVQGTALKRLWPDGSLTAIRSGLTAGLRMVFCQVNDVVAYSNGIERGVIEQGQHTSPFIPTDPFKFPMVAGQFLEWYNGRLYALKDNVLYCSDSLDVPGGIESMDERQNVVAVFDGPGKMLQRVENGLFVSAGDETFFFQGSDPWIDGGFEQRSIAPYAAIPYTSVPVKADLLGIDGLQGWACMWTSERYVCIGGNSGFFLKQEKFAFKPGRQGAAVLREQNGTVHYLATIQDATGETYNTFNIPSIDVDDETI